MQSEAVYTGLTEIARQIFGDDDLTLTPNSSAADVEGWDSLNNINFIVSAEVRFGVRLTSRDFDAIRNVGDLVNLIMSQFVAQEERLSPARPSRDSS